MRNTILKMKNTIWFLAKSAEFIVLIAGFTLIWLYEYEQAQVSDPISYIILLFYAVILFFNFKTFGCFKFEIARIGELVYSTVIALLITNILTYLVLCIMYHAIVAPQWIVLLQVIQMIFSLLYDWLINKLYYRYCTVIEVAVIYSESKISYFVISKMNRLNRKFRIKETVDQKSGMDAIKATIDRYGSVLLCDVDDAFKNEIITYCYSQSKRVYVLPSVADILINNARQVQLFDTPVYLCENSGPSNEQLFAKRCIDLLFSAVGLIVASPFMLVIALCIKLYDGGPVFYKQTRVTKDDKIMQILKFRSMCIDAEKDGSAQMAKKHDERITPVGRVIRTVRLDELPQLINILKGDMSLVGPRPERPELIEEYVKQYPEFALRTKAKAGLTGLAQVVGRYNIHPYDKVLLDLIYIEKYSVMLDIKIMLMTIKILFMPESTQGIDEGQKNADTQLNFDIAEISIGIEEEKPGMKA